MNRKNQLMKIIHQHFFDENDARRKTQTELKLFALDEFWFTAFPKAEEINNERF
jgi:hypothetical protein